MLCVTAHCDVCIWEIGTGNVEWRGNKGGAGIVRTGGFGLRVGREVYWLDEKMQVQSYDVERGRNRGKR